MNYLSTERDQQVAADAINITRDIVSKMNKKFNPREKRPGLNYQTKEELVKAAGGFFFIINFIYYLFINYFSLNNKYLDIGTTIFHPVGTCKMGLSNDSKAVVDSKLRVFGIKNLRIADCSIMPFITSGNTAAPAMLIGEKCARMILDDK